MLFLGLDAFLLFYTSAGSGIFMIACLQKIFRQQVYANPLGIVLAGLIFSTIYFNLLSLWLPVNYCCLIPLFILSSITFIKQGLSDNFFDRIKKATTFLITAPNIFATIPVCIMLAFCWCMPPVNADGPGYHYSTILWFEKFKAVPGLANVDGRLAYNSAAFIVQAAYAFTKPVGQSLYPLNGVLTLLFFLWMMKRILQSSNTLKGIAYAVLLYLLNRVLLINMPAATADTLVLVCLAYVVIQVFDGFTYNMDGTYFILPLVVLLYAITAKLSAYPAILLLPLICMRINQNTKLLWLLWRISLLSLFIYVPWLCRNVILSGYLLYPVPFIDLFTFDWKTPKDALLLDYDYIKRLPINFDDALVAVKPPPFPHWVWPWVKAQLERGMTSELAILTAALLSPVYWLVALIKRTTIKRTTFVVWAIIYVCVIMWLSNVPEYRFGIVFMSFAIVMPFLGLAVMNKGSYQRLQRALIVVLIFESGWYIYSLPARKAIDAFSLNHFLVYPMRDRHYDYDNDKSTFSYTLLNDSIKLFHQDSSHNCINADLPCAIYKYGTIEMRGPAVSDGFRNVQDDVKKNYPFVQ